MKELLIDAVSLNKLELKSNMGNERFKTYSLAAVLLVDRV